MWQGIDKRRFPRADYACRVVVFKKGQRQNFSTHTENLGSGGVCVLLKEALDKFSPVELVLYLEDGQPAVEADARVVWVVKRKSEFDTGIEFINIQEKDASRIEKIVQLALKGKSADA